jgi:methylenetetrahydrofolate dehydrogenase (NADP+) / methenyltetrahydrofolate cyclohydrolase
MKISGGQVKNGVLKRFQEKYSEEIAKANLKVEILRFATPVNASKKDAANYQAAEDSRVQKTKIFRALGVEVVEREFLPQDMPEEDFRKLIDALNTDPSVSGIIVQYPAPKKFVEIIGTISPGKDIDALSMKEGTFKVPATSEGIFRVVEPFLKEDIVVAVVGNKGFVGKGIVNLLKEHDIATIELDQAQPGFKDSDLLAVKKADIVISATGQPGILDERHLSPEQLLVVDCGYFPQGNEKLGDVARRSVGIPQNYTPVPGGIGPIEMAILLERVIQQYIDPNVIPWKIVDYIEISTNSPKNQNQAKTNEEILEELLNGDAVLVDRREEFQGDELDLNP